MPLWYVSDSASSAPNSLTMCSRTSCTWLQHSTPLLCKLQSTSPILHAETVVTPTKIVTVFGAASSQRMVMRSLQEERKWFSVSFHPAFSQLSLMLLHSV